MAQPLGEDIFRKLAYYPFEEDHDKALYFRDINPEMFSGWHLPDFFEVAKLDGVKRHELTMRTNAVNALNTRDLTAAALSGIGAKQPQLVELLGTSRPGQEAQRKLGGSALQTNTIAPNLVGLSFWRGAILPDERAASKIDRVLQPLAESRLRNDLVSIVTCVAKGMPNRQIGIEFGRTKWWADAALFELNARLGTTTPELVMVIGGLGLLPQDEAPPYRATGLIY